MGFERAYLHDLARTVRQYKRLGDGALAQVSVENLHTLVDPGANSIAIVMKHIAGNLRSRFTDFLTSDGEKPGRNRDGEFEMPATTSREDLLASWNEGFAITLTAIEALKPADLDRTIYTAGGVSRRRSAEPIGLAHRVSRRPDRLPGEALRRPALDDAEHPEGPVGPGVGRLQEARVVDRQSVPLPSNSASASSVCAPFSVQTA